MKQWKYLIHLWNNHGSNRKTTGFRCLEYPIVFRPTPVTTHPNYAKVLGWHRDFSPVFSVAAPSLHSSQGGGFQRSVPFLSIPRLELSAMTAFNRFNRFSKICSYFFIFWVTMFSFHKCWSVIAKKHRYLIYHQLLDPLWNRLKYHVLPKFSTDISSNICHIRSSWLGKIQATTIEFPQPPATPLYQ